MTFKIPLEALDPQPVFYRLCVVIPTYNHHRSLPSMIASLMDAGLEVMLVDDGSNNQTVLALKALESEGVVIIRLDQNQGKGIAVATGLEHAWQRGYTHAFQIDADGQHDLAAVKRFWEVSRNHPSKLICGWPLYDASVPVHRRMGRWVTHFWVWVETLSFNVKESMCGFRIYPLEASLRLLKTRRLESGMAFDTQILVRLCWLGVGVHMERVNVSYPQDNHSHFRMIKDNWEITRMHTRLVLELLWRWPFILYARYWDKIFCAYTPQTEAPRAPGWHELKERGSGLGIKALAWGINLLGPRVCFYLSFPMVVYFYLAGRSQRQSANFYWSRVSWKQGLGGCYKRKDVFIQYLNFTQKCLDQVALWRHKSRIFLEDTSDKKNLLALLESPKGGLFLVSHLGNIEVLRAAYGQLGGTKLHILMHTKNARKYHDLVESFDTGAQMNIIEVSDLGPHTILTLREKLEQGDWIIIGADRVPLETQDHVISFPFLGQEAHFAGGPHILGALLECPVYTLFSFREKNSYKVFVDFLSEKILLRRSQKNEDLKLSVKKYVDILEKYTLLYPHQWYNFYDYWKL